jgi:Ca-activated chloride channel homolog
MRFANPHFLWALLAVPGFAALLWWSYRRRQQVLRRYASPAVLNYLAAGYSARKVLIKSILVLLAITGATFAAARPQWGFEDRHIISRGLDIIVAVDVSNSMLAKDYEPNRLARAKDILQNILWRAKGNRLGVIAFAGGAYVQCPLTLDYSMAKIALQAMSVNSVPTQGTALGAAIDTATKAFQAGSSGERVLVLLTDGEDQGSQPIEAATAAAKENVRIYTIGIGTTQGMPIPFQGGYKQDKSGRIVNSRLDFTTLAKISQLTNGKAIKANTRGNAELDAILVDIDRLQKAQQQDKVFRVYTERFQWFLLPAIVLLIWEALETGYSRSRRTWKGRMVQA